MKLGFLALTAVAGTLGLCDLCGTSPQSSAAGAVPVAQATQIAVPSARRAAAVDTVVLHVEGMDCGGCTVAVRRVLQRLDGVSKAEVSYEQKRAVVTFDPAKVTTAQMIAAIATLKYTATVVRP